MITKIPDNIKGDIKQDIAEKFNVAIDDDIIDFIQDFQSKVAVEDGFANKDEVRFFNLFRFVYNEAKIDSRHTMQRLINKHDGDRDKALAEFKLLGRDVIIQRKKEKARKQAEVSKIPHKRDVVKSLKGGFSCR